jgi:23S rRNA A1618 N6-methylase RlmF
MSKLLSDSRAIEILKHHCDPKIYPTEEKMLCGLTDMIDRETIASLRDFLGKVIDDDSIAASQKAKKYFSLSISNEEKAETFIDEVYCSISEYLFADEE